MDDAEFNLEIRKLLSSETAIEPYYESIKFEVAAILDAYNEHYIALTSFQDFSTFEDFLACVNTGEEAGREDDQPQGTLAYEIDALIQKDLEKYPVLTSGEVRVSGEGVYLCLPTPENASQLDDDLDLDVVSDGATIVGDIRYYSVGPIVSYDEYMLSQNITAETELSDDDAPRETVGLLLHISNATVIEPNSVDSKPMGDVVVPLNFPSLVFDKVIRGTVPPKEELMKPKKPMDIVTHIKSGFVAEAFANIENDLNYNDYAPEEIGEMRREHQLKLEEYAQGIDMDGVLSLTAFSAAFHNGKEIGLVQQEVFYLQAVILKIKDAYRVAHSFHIQTEHGPLVAHVLPEHILGIRYINDK